MRGFFLISCLLLLYGCDVFDTKEETIPGYVVITSADLETNPDQGANTSNILDATVFANSEFVGTFELPATVPILQTGPVKLQVAAGIKNNGLVSDRVIYPFYDFVRKDVTIIPDATVPITEDSSITFHYFSTGINYEIESFDDLTNLSVTATNLDNSEWNIISSPPEDVQTGRSLEAILPADTGRFDMLSTWHLHDLPKGNSMYLEIDFKGTVPLEIGVVAIPSFQYTFALGLKPREEYTKVYVELTDEISRQIDVDQFEIYLTAQSSPGGTEDKIYIDNLKFVYP